MDLIKEFASHKPYALSLRFTKDGKQLVSTGMDNLAFVWETSDWSKSHTISGHEKSANAQDFS